MEKLNIYLSSLAVLNVKLHNLHWNLKGENFITFHKFTEELYEKSFEAFDEVAELLKMKQEFPLASLKDYSENSIISEIPSKHYTIAEVLDILMQDYDKMYIFAKEIRKLADDNGENSIVLKFDDYIAEYEKNLWFIRSMKA
jgi:starvation-inducible DNA-binding protein